MPISLDFHTEGISAGSKVKCLFTRTAVTNFRHQHVSKRVERIQAMPGSIILLGFGCIHAAAGAEARGDPRGSKAQTETLKHSGGRSRSLKHYSDIYNGTIDSKAAAKCRPTTGVHAVAEVLRCCLIS